MLGCQSILEAQTRLTPLIHELMETLAEVGEDPELDRSEDEEAA
jgi:hypothetical protein